MAQTLTARAELLSQKTNIQQQIILEIDGISLVFGALEVTKLIRYGDGTVYGQSGAVYGGVVEDENSRDWINLDGSTKSISQQLRQEEGVSSVTTVKIRLIDKKEALSSLFAPVSGEQDIISRRAQVYLNFVGGAHPEDSIKIFEGTIETSDFGSGYVDLSIKHPEDLKRQEVFITRQTQLDGAIDASQTTITVDSTADFLTPADLVSCYIRIDDEIIQYTGKTDTTFTGCWPNFMA